MTSNADATLDGTANTARRPPERSGRLDVLVTEGPADYALLDAGEGRKLERFGHVVVDRPEPQALWSRRLKAGEWAQAHAVFSASGDDDEKGKWRFDKRVPESWPVKVRGATMICRLQGLWHLGLFPEQLPHWEWMLERLAAVKGERPRVLNLFAYTGAASLIAAKAGAEVTHVDASKKAIQWAKENQAASGLGEAPVRWILDDAVKFVAREVRRGRTYHVVLIDPPKFGRGPDGEVWDLFTGLPPMLRASAALLAPGASLILTSYAIRASALAFEELAADVLSDRGGRLECGELALAARGGGVKVPTSLYVRWAS
jgi:23S rRNA (cytosine1962-C5)-methyltransferase